MSERGRVVSLLPAATEMIVALGAWDRLAGVTHECDFPPQVRDLPRVTSSAIDVTQAAHVVDATVRERVAKGEPLFVLDEERIRAIAPSLIVTQGLCEVCAIAEGDVHRLAESLATPAVVLSLGARTFDEVLTSIVDVARALDDEDEGKEFVFGLQARTRRVHDTLKQARAPRPRVAVIEWTDPPYVAGHWVPDMIRRAGGIDALATSGEHSRPRTLDEIRASAHDMVIFAPCGYALDRAADEARITLAREEWAWARSLRLAAMDGSALTSRPGPRLVDGIEVLARLLHPVLFSPLAPGRGAVLSSA